LPSAAELQGNVVRSSLAGPVTSLEKLLQTNQREGSVSRFRLANDAAVFDFNSEGNGGEKLGVLELYDSYEEKYLVGLTLEDGT
jgi:hypothetical protein